VIEHVAVLAEPGQPIQPQDIPAYEDGSSSPARTTMSGAIMDEPYHAAKDRLIAEFEREYLSRLSARAGGNMSRAARLANIDRTTLYRLMEKHNVRRDELSGNSE
jgi:DNA-binding NtrC family response regulator